MRAARAEPDADLAVQRRVVDAFLAASRQGEFEALVALLDPEVVLRIDRPGDPTRVALPAVGIGPVTEVLRDQAGRFAPHGRPATVNGSPGVVVGPPGRVVAVVAIAVVGGLVREIDIVTDRATLGRLGLTTPGSP